MRKALYKVGCIHTLLAAAAQVDPRCPGELILGERCHMCLCHIIISMPQKELVKHSTWLHSFQTAWTGFLPFDFVVSPFSLSFFLLGRDTCEQTPVHIACFFGRVALSFFNTPMPRSWLLLWREFHMPKCLLPGRDCFQAVGIQSRCVNPRTLTDELWLHDMERCGMPLGSTILEAVAWEHPWPDP